VSRGNLFAGASASLLAACALPASIPLLPVLLLVSASLAASSVDRASCRVALLVAGASLFVACGSGSVSLSFSVVLLAGLVCVLAAQSCREKFLGLIPAVTQLSIGASFWANSELILGPAVHLAKPEAALSMVFAIGALRTSPARVAAFSMAPLCALVASVAIPNWTAAGPTVIAVAAACILMLQIRSSAELRGASLRAFTIALVLAIGTWMASPPRLHSEIGVLAPSEGEWLAADLENAQSVWEFFGFPIDRWSASEEIPKHALVVVPIPSATLSPGISWSEFVELAREREWTVLTAAEHTDLLGASSRLNESIRAISVRHDTSVPIGNSNELGVTGTTMSRPLHWSSQINRGASLRVQGLATRVLVSASGWHSDRPHTVATGALGNFRPEPGEPRGWFPLAVVSEERARWVVVTDNSFLLDRFVVADPRPVLWFLQASTLWPLFLSDILVASIAACVLVGTHSRARFSALAIVSVVAAAMSLAVQCWEPSRVWRDAYLGQSAHDPSNFNRALVKWADVFDGSAPGIKRYDAVIDQSSFARSAAKVHFGLVRDGARLGGVILDECQRLGALSVGSGLRLTDAQACVISGPAVPLIGRRDGASAFRITEGADRGKVVVLDKEFLSNRALETENFEWLVEMIGEGLGATPDSVGEESDRPAQRPDS